MRRTLLVLLLLATSCATPPKPAVKSAAQGLITLATYGLGMLVGFSVAGWLTDLYALPGGHDWGRIWLYPAAFAVLILALFAVSFRNETLRGESA